MATAATFALGRPIPYPGFPSAAIVLPGKMSMDYIGTISSGAGTVIAVGELSGAATATLLGGATGGALTYRIGSRNTAATFGGAIGKQGTLRILGSLTSSGGQLAGAGAVENDGIIDMMTGFQSPPANFVNHGIVLDSSKVVTTGCPGSGASFAVSVKGFVGHSYQLQKAGGFRPIPGKTSPRPSRARGPLDGAGAQLDLVDPSATGSKNFYRMLVPP